MTDSVFEHPDRWYVPAGTSAKGWPLVRCVRPDGPEATCDDLVDANVAFKNVHDLDHECREAFAKAELARRRGLRPWPDPPLRKRRPVVYKGRSTVTVPPRGDSL